MGHGAFKHLNRPQWIFDILKGILQHLQSQKTRSGGTSFEKRIVPIELKPSWQRFFPSSPPPPLSLSPSLSSISFHYADHQGLKWRWWQWLNGKGLKRQRMRMRMREVDLRKSFLSLLWIHLASHASSSRGEKKEAIRFKMRELWYNNHSK